MNEWVVKCLQTIESAKRNGMHQVKFKRDNLNCEFKEESEGRDAIVYLKKYIGECGYKTKSLLIICGCDTSVCCYDCCCDKRKFKPESWNMKRWPLQIALRLQYSIIHNDYFIGDAS
jgi:hypothetical protein